MNLKNIQSNVLLTIFQVAASGLVFFLLYKYLFETLGPEKIGLWSLLIGITAVSRIGELGLTGGVVKFISEAVAHNNFCKASKIIQTVFISLMITVLILIFISYVPIQNILIFATKEEEIVLIKQILPISFLSIFLMILIGVLSGSMDGIMLMGLKNFFLGVSHILFLFLVYKMVPIYGLIGVAYSQCIQYFILMVFMWLTLKREIKNLPIIPFQWDFQVIKDMFSYAINFQAISLVGMFWEPIIKIMMSYWGGLTSLGFYEMANKLILQTRNIIVESARIVVPVTAKNNATENDPNIHFTFVQNTMNITSFSLFYIFSLIAIFLPLISIFWHGSLNFTFIYFAFILLVGWFFSSFNAPIFLINLGTGHVRQNLYTYIIMAATSIIFGNVLGYFFMDLGVTFGVALSLIFSALYLGSWYKNNIFDPGFSRLLDIYKSVIIITPILSIISIYSVIHLDLITSLIVISFLVGAISIFCYTIFRKLNLMSLILKNV